MRRLVIALFILVFSAPAIGAPLILNEYNGVREDKVLKDGGADPFLGTPAGTAVLGNGSLGAPSGDQNDWFELVVVADHLDARGWEFRLIDDGNVLTPLVLSQDSLWADLRAGTLIVVFESDDIPEDLDASDGRLAVRVNGNGNTASTYLGPQQDIDVSNTDFEITIADHKGRVIFGPSGEAIAGEGVNSEEVFKLEADPTAIVTGADAAYNDGSSSTFGTANVFSAGTMTQDLSNLLNGTPVLDADFDGIADCRDNCRDVYNPDQTNTDRDGAGNACDQDVNNDGVVGTPDFNAVRSGLGLSLGDPGFEELFDFNDDDTIDSLDLNILNGSFGGAPGPGAQANPLCDVNDPTVAVFDPLVLHQVDIVMAPADWDFVRTQTRNLLTALPCAEVEPTSPFIYRPATVTVNGTILPNVGVRKKGFQGSLSTSRPSLKVDFGEFVSGQQYSGMDRLTLNNMRQDPSGINTCMSYYLMAQAGVPAPRCNYAHVTVNGVDMGIYANVESIKNPYLIRNFGSAAGRLYEGTLADIRAGYFGRLEIKNGGDRGDLLPLAHLLEGTDAEIVAGLASHLDVDFFLTFWAMEGLIGHWDGYNQGNNNFYIYNDPATGIRFFPWGADATLDGLSGFGPMAAVSPAVFLNSQLAKRLWDIPSFQAQFLTRLNEMRTLVFPSGGSPAVIAEVDRQGALVNDPADPWFSAARATEIARRRQWVIDRYDHVTAELAVGPTSPATLAPRSCLQLTPGDSVTIDVDVAVTDDNTAPVSCPTCGTPNIVVGGSTATGFSHLQKFDRSANPIGRDSFGLQSILLGSPLSTAVIVSVDPTLAPASLPAVITIPDGLGNGIVASFTNPTNFFLGGFLTGAQLSLTSFGTNVGDRVVGQLTGDVLTFTNAPPNPLPPLPGAPISTSGSACGVGFELSLILPAVLWLRRRRVASALLGAVLVLGVLGAPQRSDAVPIVELVFVQQNGVGIAPTNSVSANVGDKVVASLQITADAAGVSSYGVSVEFDVDGLDELELIGLTEVVHAAFDIDLGGSGPISQTDSVPGAAGSILTLAAGATGPGIANATFQIALLTFAVNASVIGDGIDLMPTFQNTGVDSIFSTSGADLTLTALLQGASVGVPEPAVGWLMVLGGLAAVTRRRAL